MVDVLILCQIITWTKFLLGIEDVCLKVLLCDTSIKHARALNDL